MKDYKDMLRQVISNLYAIMLTILFVVVFIVLGLYFGVFSNHVILGKVQESNYYNEVHEELNKSAKEILAMEGLDEDLLQDVITLDRVYVSGKNYIESTLKGDSVSNSSSSSNQLSENAQSSNTSTSGQASIKTDRLREDLYNNIQDYLNSQNITMTEELEAGVNEIITKIEKEYVRGIQFQFIRYISMYKSKFIGVIKWLLPITILLIGFLSWLLIYISKYKHRGVRYITYSVMASTGLVLFWSVILLVTKAYKKFEISPRYYNRFIESYLYQDILVFIYISGIGVIISILLISVTTFMKKHMPSKGSK